MEANKGDAGGDGGAGTSQRHLNAGPAHALPPAHPAARAWAAEEAERPRPPRASTVDGPVITEGASGVPTPPRCPRGCRPVSAPLPASPPTGR